MKVPYFDFNLADLTRQIQDALVSPVGSCIVQGVPCSEDNTALEALASALGEPLLEPHNLNGGMVCRVEVEADEHRPYANTPWHFPAHTDCTDHLNPPHTVLLLCEQPAVTGGDSMLALLPEVLGRLSPDDLFALQEAQFYFRFGYLSILTLSQGRIAIRYSRQMLEMFKPSERPFTLVELLDRLDQAIAAVSFTFSLHRGDCLILNNHSTLHGRTSFEDDGTRLLKRVRVTNRAESGQTA